jgi:hypothetical protein
MPRRKEEPMEDEKRPASSQELPHQMRGFVYVQKDRNQSGEENSYANYTAGV